jgi:long-chain acyl-CoA synthetase
MISAIFWPPKLLHFLRVSVFGGYGLQSTSHVDFDEGRNFRTLKPKRNGEFQFLNYPFSESENTAHQVLQKAFESYGELPCLGTRTFIKMHKPDGAKFPLKVFGETTWQTYNDLALAARAFGAGLRTLGMEPMSLEMAQDVVKNFVPITGPHSIVIFEETCAEWTTACIGAMGQSITVATSYSTLGMNAVAEALNETAAPVIVCNLKDVVRVAKACEEACPNLKSIVFTKNYCTEDEIAAGHPETIGRLNIFSMDKVIEQGRNSPCDFAEPTGDHIGLIMYTSGSTGKPKGVMLKQSAICAAIASLEGYFMNTGHRATCKDDQQTYLAYLPAAHILEFSAEMSMLTHGAKLGYSDPKTISSAGALRQMPDGTYNDQPTGFGNSPPGGIQEFAPTSMAAVPKIWDILKKGVEDSIDKKGPVMRAIFQAAFSARSAALQQGREAPLLGLLFKKVGGALGGRVKVAISGGGPLNAEVQNFIRVAMHFNLIQGYGLTESCSCGTIQMPDSVADGIVGPPVGCISMHLESCDAKDDNGAYEFLDRSKKPYLSTDKMHYNEPCLGRGEVWLRGRNMSSGYYCKEAATKKEFDEQGWFHTGDIAIWTPNGTLKIVDRLKNLVKLKGGEYVAIESMEATYAASVFVNGKNGGVMCYADGDMDKPVALVQVNDYELKKWAQANNVEFDSVETLCKNPEAVKMVCADMNSIGKATLGGNEALASVALLPGTGNPEVAAWDSPWTPENGCLTAANKLARNIVKVELASVVAEVKPKGIR